MTKSFKYPAIADIYTKIGEEMCGLNMLVYDFSLIDLCICVKCVLLYRMAA